jgi:predicted lipoprotein with Yx(FWY)xxD motif
MKIPTLLLTAATLAVAGCSTYEPGPRPGPYGPAAGSYGPASVTVVERPPFGAYLVAGNGRSVYILEGTRGGAGMERCSGECLRVWPPLAAGGPPLAGPGLDPRRLSVVRGYAGAQLAYDGWPLYYYHHDRRPGDTTGQGVRDRWGAWYLLSPSGAPIGSRGGY